MKPIFVGGSMRSGTTMLGSIIGGHKNIVCIPEANFIYEFTQPDNIFIKNKRSIWRNIIIDYQFLNQWRFTESELKKVTLILEKLNSFRALVEMIITVYCERKNQQNCKFWVSHSPRNIINADKLLEQFTEAKFIHIVRDGRAVASSYQNVSFGANNSYFAASLWSKSISLSFMTQYLVNKPEIFLTVYYEKVLLDTDNVIKNLCQFINISFDINMQKNSGYNIPESGIELHKLIGQVPYKQRAEAWKTELPVRDIAIFEKHAGDALRLLGYSKTDHKYHFPFYLKAMYIINEFFFKKRRKNKKMKYLISIKNFLDSNFNDKY